MNKREITPPKGFRDPRALAGLPADAPLAVALSGGADSVALLDLLADGGNVYVLHVHHGIRGEEADRDAAFCRRIAKERRLPFAELRVDVPAMARERGESLETAAREARYGAMEAWLSAHGIKLLATAHHADDQLETMLQHLLRGAGLGGLCGIPACRPLGRALVVRPLLQVPKQEILAYLAARGLSYVDDSTNGERFCQRNRLRLDVLPLLRELCPDASEQAAQCAERLAQDERYLTSLAREFIKGEGETLSVAALSALPRPVFVRVMREWLPEAPLAVHLSALWELVKRAKPHASLSLPLCRVSVENGALCCLPAADAVTPDDYSVLLQQGENEIPAANATVVLGELSAAGQTELAARYRYRAAVKFPAAEIKGALYLRPRREGDKILSGGMHKAVRRLRGLSPLPLAVRARMPLLCDSAGVLAVPLGATRDSVGARDLTVYFFFS